MNICIIQTRPGIGDMCIFLPFIHLISKVKKKKILLVTKERTRAKDFLVYDPYISEIIYIDKKNKKFSIYEISKILKKKKLEEVYIMHFGIRYFLLSFFLLAKKTYFYGIFKRNVGVSEFIKKKIKDWLKIDRVKYECKIFLKKKNKQNNNVIIGIGGSGENKKWKIKKFEKLIRLLSNKKNIKSFIIAGGNEEIEDANQIIKNNKNLSIRSICKLNIMECLEIISGSLFYVGNDTGFMHLCSSLNIISFGLFGDTPINYADYNKLIKVVTPKNRPNITHDSKSMDCIECNHVFSEIVKHMKFKI